MRACAPTRRTRDWPTSSRRDPRAASSCSGSTPSFLPRHRRAGRRRPARAAGAHVRAQRQRGSGAAGGRRAAVERLLGSAPRPARCRSKSERGTSWQAQLVLGALPEHSEFPSARAELMFAPAESLPFAIDVSLNARFLPNDLALRIARKRIQDADQIVRAESDGDQGVSDLGYARTQEARDLLSYLQAASRPPLLRATLAVAVGARDERGARAAGRDVPTCVRRDPPASPARRSAPAFPSAPAGPAHTARRV